MKEKPKNRIKVDYLYIDLNVCNRCLGTDTALYEAIRDTGQILETSGIELTLTKTLVETEEQAAELGFLTSPTIRINGRDIQEDIKESTCESCGDICGDSDIDCREWEYQGKIYNVAPKGLIVDAILGEVYGGKEPVPEGSHKIPIEKVPANLKKFFAAMRAQETQQAEASVCGPSCCGPAPTETATSCCGPAPTEATTSCCGPAPTEAASPCFGAAPIQSNVSPVGRVEATVQTYQTSYPCAQSLLSVYADEFGLDKEIALKVAAPFVGGMGMRGETCGAVTGAFMVLGLKYGGIKDRGTLVMEMQRLLAEFVNKFEARHGSINCEKLLGVNISTPDGFKTAAEKGLLSTLCPNLVRNAAEITEELLASEPVKQQTVASSGSVCSEGGTCPPNCCS
ncbi:MAG: DUF2703 domain-containing protein [Deltaproteobacteria bacterium]|nr:MAG: DUF2703 domain-containing protein [Deltaproteobacteria bacterium]